MTARDAEDQLGDGVFQSLKNGRPHACRHIDGDALDDAAQRLPALAGVPDVLFHLFALCIVAHREILSTHFQDILLSHLGAAESVIADAVDAGDVRTGINTPALQNLTADCAGKAQRSGESARKNGRRHGHR